MIEIISIEKQHLPEIAAEIQKYENDGYICFWVGRIVKSGTEEMSFPLIYGALLRRGDIPGEQLWTLRRSIDGLARDFEGFNLRMDDVETFIEEVREGFYKDQEDRQS